MAFDFEKMFQAAPSPYVLLDRDLRMVWANEEYLRVTGRTRESVIGRIMTEEFPSDPASTSGQMLRNSFRRVFETGAPDHLPLIPYPIENADGTMEERVWSATHTPVAGADGSTEYVLQNTFDVTDLYRNTSLDETGSRRPDEAEIARRAEIISLRNLELDSAVEFLSSVFDQAPSFMAITVGPTHVFRITNAAYMRIVGERQMIGKTVLEALPEVVDQGYLELLDEVYRSGAPYSVNGAPVQVMHDGKLEDYVVDFVYQPILDDEGNTTGIFIQGNDVTAQSKAERQLREAEQRFRTMAQTMPAHVWTATPDGHLDWLSERIYAETGYEEGALFGEDWLKVVHPDDRPEVLEVWSKALTTGQRYETEFRIRRADGEYIWHLVRATPITDDDGRILRWVGTNVDIDEQKTVTAALADLNATLEERVERRNRELGHMHERLRHSQKLEAIGTLSGGIAHDFNNLLQAISGSLTLAQRELGEGSPAAARLGTAMRAVERGANLSSQLLAFSRQQPLQPRPFDLSQLLADMNDLLLSALGEGIDVAVEAADRLWPVFADPANMENAILNLALNARDAMEGRGQLRISLVNRTFGVRDLSGDTEMEPGDYVELTVTDEGVGMSQDAVEKAFEPFYTTKPVGKGTGLGLPTVYGYARQSGGRITLDSRPGEGTSVTLALPRAHEPPVSLPHKRGHAIAGGGETILLVEDDPEVRGATAALLQDLGYSTLTAANPDEALVSFGEGARFDMLLTDVVMPGEVTSREMVERIQGERPDLPVLFISGFSRREIVHDGRVDKGVQFLSKPFTQETLARKVREVLDSAPRPDAPGPETAAEAPAPLAPRGPPRVLLVEDDALIRMDLAMMLEEMGIEVAEAASVAEALAQLETGGFDLMLTDIGLPDGNGEELAREARERHPELRLIFATGRSQLAQELPGSLLLPKPFSHHAVAEAIETATGYVAA
ncbi:PAS sensor Signal Tranduction Histidine Kinase [Oceanicola granulosus HTCC2516]|uniref:histidine kinase n=1 Tax=Oceanicola granulosus (strain ATCC BAA-861 / DSM 15982 / KCTC 12143 / HTCC2516) TaxID=314256 RepID=Q2CEI1_OCEGH|nr:response regulator [Oceanicola granulosus]EAR51016.1 PAS sensor Signal Tranduction Histidine Kinase [Oceanicola granulosus HTCC2516]